MKYLKTYESTDFTKENSEILNMIDILTSFIDDLVELKFEEGVDYTHREGKPIQAFAKCNGSWNRTSSQRYDLISFAKYINENIDKPISTIDWTISGSSKNLDDKELDLAIEEFMNRIEDFSPNCKINNFRKKVEKNSIITNSKDGYKTSSKSDATITLQMFDSDKTRYKHLLNYKKNFPL
jgi:hypothetical protein